MIQIYKFGYNLKRVIMEKTILLTIVAVMIGCGQGSAQADVKKKIAPKKTIKINAFC